MCIRLDRQRMFTPSGTVFGFIKAEIGGNIEDGCADSITDYTITWDSNGQRGDFELVNSKQLCYSNYNDYDGYYRVKVSIVMDDYTATPLELYIIGLPVGYEADSRLVCEDNTSLYVPDGSCDNWDVTSDMEKRDNIYDYDIFTADKRYVQ